jgi:ankyrin repeat protein
MAEQHPQQRRDPNHLQQHLLERLLLQRQLHERGPRRVALMERDGDHPPVAVMVMEQEGDNADDGAMWPPHAHVQMALLQHLRGRNADQVSPLLFDMIREGCTCTSVLSGWLRDDEGCSKTVQQCTSTPDQAFYISPHSGRSPLHEACLRNSCSHVIKALLLANPLGAMDRDLSGNIPLHSLFLDNSYQFVQTEEMDVICQELLQVDPNAMAVATNSEGDNPLHMAALAPESMIHSNIFVKLLAANPACAAALNHRLQTPLSLYCQQRQANSAVAAILLEAHPDAVRQPDFAGKTPLHDAAFNLNTDLMRHLVHQAPDTASVRDRQNKTPVHLMCQQQPRDIHIPALDALLLAAPEAVAVADNVNGQTPLHIACRVQRPSLDVIRRLIQANPDATSKVDAESYTALHHACENGADVEVISLLLSAYGMAARTVTRKQDFPIHIACGANTSTESVRLLIDANRDALTMKNDYGFTPLHCVCRAYQPRMGIVQALLEACPSSVILRTHGGETATHLACSSAAFVGVLQLLTLAQTTVTGNMLASDLQIRETSTTNKVGNTPLHEACFRGASFEHVETLAKASPEWIVVRNNAGYTPLQVMCKGGRLDERVVTVFSRIRGQEVFSVMDSTGHTPLHSACREGTNVAAIRSLIRAFPDALHLKTTYGDNPLHLACFRRAGADVVYEVARAACDGRHKALLERNTAGQSPIGIAMEEFQTVCSMSFCCVTSTYNYTQIRAFEVLATLVKILYYGAAHHEEVSGPASLVKACVCLHRRDVRLDPAFISRAIHLHPEEVRMVDEDGNYPLHIEASIPVEKMSLLDGPTTQGCCSGTCHSRTGVLGTLLCAYPEATRVRNEADEFPLGLMIQNGRSWDQTFALALRNFPPALHWYKGMDDKFISLILARVSKECGHDTLYELLNSRPDMVRKRD